MQLSKNSQIGQGLNGQYIIDDGYLQRVFINCFYAYLLSQTHYKNSSNYLSTTKMLRNKCTQR